MKAKAKQDLKIDWDLTPLFANDSDPKILSQRKTVHKKSYEFINKWKDRRDYLEKPAVLKQALDEYESWAKSYGTDGAIGYYLHLRQSLDQADPELKAKINLNNDISRQIQNDIRFFTHRLSLVPISAQKKFLAYKPLLPYKHFLERLFAEAKHRLTEPEERIVSHFSDVALNNWVHMTSEFISVEEREILTESGKKVKKNFSQIIALVNSANKKVRDSAAKAVNEIFLANLKVAETEMNSVLTTKKIDDTLRSFPRPDSARHLQDDIDTAVVDALISAVSSRNNIAHRYYALKAKLLKVKQLAYHERNVPYGKISRKYSYPEAVSLVTETLDSLDPKFGAIYQNFINHGQFDVPPRKGKTGGAFCTGYLQTHPTYILLNFTGQLQDILTIAHEVGHGINNELIRETQHALYYETPTSTAEVASTFMEDFVLKRLLTEADDELRLTLMVHKLDDDISAIFRQVACYRFEQELHTTFRAQGYLSKEEIGALFQQQMQAYMGQAVAQPPEAKNWWTYWAHIRMFFYVYSYASGQLISKSLQQSVSADPKFITKVKKFLAAGTSDSPHNIFKSLGVDITKPAFWNRGLDEIEELLNNTERLAKKLKKI